MGWTSYACKVCGDRWTHGMATGDEKQWCFLFVYMYTMSQKTVQNYFFSELRQISTNFDNFWQKDGKEAEIMCGALIFHLT